MWKFFLFLTIVCFVIVYALPRFAECPLYEGMTALEQSIIRTGLPPKWNFVFKQLVGISLVGIIVLSFYLDKLVKRKKSKLRINRTWKIYRFFIWVVMLVSAIQVVAAFCGLLQAPQLDIKYLADSKLISNAARFFLGIVFFLATSPQRKEIKIRQLMGLTIFDYRKIIRMHRDCRKNIEREFNIADILLYQAFQCICSCDASFLNIIKNESLMKGLPADIQSSILYETGQALYYIGCREEGVKYLSRAVEVCTREKIGHKILFQWFLCMCLNDAKDAELRFNTASEGAKIVPDGGYFDIILAKSYIAKKMYEQAGSIVEKIKTTEERAYAGYLQAEMCFAKGDYKKACELYEPLISNVYFFWAVECDYKMVLAFYYSGHKDWRKSAAKIKQRLSWDKYYTLDFIENAGITREPEVDAYIEQFEARPLLLDTERLAHYARVIWILAAGYSVGLILGLSYIISFVLLIWLS